MEGDKKRATLYEMRINKFMRNWTPIFIENSSVPIWLSRLAPIEIKAITLGFLVFSRGELDVQTRRHETIHFQQFLETLFLGFLLLYFWDYLLGYVRYRNGYISYRSIRAEIEAYAHDHEPLYLSCRKRWRWIARSENPFITGR